MKQARLLLVLVILVALCGCGDDGPVERSWGRMKDLDKVVGNMGDDIVFLTVMTGKSNAYNDHATADTAKEWASRFNLPKERVVAAELWFKTVPEHRLYSPKGHTLFVHVGFLQAQQIKDVIAYYKTGWEEWDRTGEYASWMFYE